MGLPIPGPGRDSKYRTEYNEQARKLCLLGYIDVELAGFFDISESTLNEWKRQYPAFSESIRAGKEAADAEVADSLYRRAVGEEILVEKVMKKADGEYDRIALKQYVPGDVQAQRLWLLNRRKASWRDKVETHHSGDIVHRADPEQAERALERVERAIAALAGTGGAEESGPLQG